MAPMISREADSLPFSSNAGPGNATVTQGSVSLGHGTCTYIGPFGAGSFGIVVAAAAPPFQAPQCFSIIGMTCGGVTSPATMSVAYCGRYHRWKNSFEYAYSLGMFSMSLMNPIVVCL